jgi:hypothetical protein
MKEITMITDCGWKIGFPVGLKKRMEAYSLNSFSPRPAPRRMLQRSNKRSRLSTVITMAAGLDCRRDGVRMDPYSVTLVSYSLEI